MKKRYEALELEVVRFSNEDVITASVEEPPTTPEPTPEVLIRNPDGPERRDVLQYQYGVNFCVEKCGYHLCG